MRRPGGFCFFAAALILCGCPLDPCRRQGPLANQGIGDPCLDGSECSASLMCLPAFFLGREGTATRGGNACTIDCSTTTCPAGSACADALYPGGGSRVCLPTCSTDDDCRTSTRAASCVTTWGSTLPVCVAFFCDERYPCPAGYWCVDPGCNGGPSPQFSTGWCRREGS